MHNNEHASKSLGSGIYVCCGSRHIQTLHTTVASHTHANYGLNSKIGFTRAAVILIVHDVVVVIVVRFKFAIQF